MIIARYVKPGHRLTPVQEDHRVAPYFEHEGHIKESIERGVARQLNRGNAVFVEVAEVTGGTPDRPTRGVNIEARWRRMPESLLIQTC